MNLVRPSRVLDAVSVPAPRLDPTPAAILFDLDGTLVDTMGHFADLAADVMRKHYGLAWKNARQLYLRTSGIPFCKQLEVIFGAIPQNGAAADEFETRKHALAEGAEMDTATRLGLEALRARGISLVVSSNGMQSHVDGFSARYPGLFDLAFGFGGGLGKGEPHVSAVCDRLGLGRDRLAFVGDSLRDGELAAECSVRFVGRLGTFSRDEFDARFPGAPVIDSVADLPALV